MPEKFDTMADEFDVEAMLEAPYRKEAETSRNGERTEKSSSSRRGSKSRDRVRDRDRDRERRSKSRDREHKSSSTRDRDRRSRSRDRDRKRDRRDRERYRSRSREPQREITIIPRRRSRDRKRRSRSRDRRNRSMSRSPIRITRPEFDMTPEERDARTVFCMQLSARIRPRDLEEFFSSVGKVRDVRIITDNKTRRSKGIAYIEFKDTESVPLALGLTGQRLLGVPIIVQVSQAEKNRQVQAAAAAQKGVSGPMRLYVGSLHFNITEDMLRGIFEPFGKIDEIKLIRNHETNRSQGYGFITGGDRKAIVQFHNADDAKKALEQLNGFELAGRPMKVGHVTERTAEAQGQVGLDTDEMDRAGVDLGATGRLALMAKLAEGTGFELPQAATEMLTANVTQQQQQQQQQQQPQQQQQQPAVQTPPIATQCFMLSNMFDPITETSATWDNDIRDDVIEECNKHGGVLHIYVDKASPQGNVYVKCPSISAAAASVNALHGRFFAGKVITAAYVPLPNYHSLFPDALRALQLLIPSTQSIHSGLLQAGPAAPPIPQNLTFI